MDVTPYRELRIAPRAVFDRALERGDRPRFHVFDGVGWNVVTWGEFARDIRHAACALSALGVQPGDRVAVYAGNSVPWAVSALAIQAMGGVLVPIYPSSTAEQAAYVLGHSDSRAVFVTGGVLVRRVAEVRGSLPALEHVVLLDEHAEGADDVLTWSTLLAKGAEADRATPGAFEAGLDAVSLEQLGMMLYTSGTSGPPKGVPLTHRNVGENGRDWLDCNAPVLHEDAVDLMWLPMSHVFGFGEMCLGNTLGFTTWLTTPMAVMAQLPEIRPTVFMSVPSVWEKLALQAMAAASDDHPEAEAMRRQRLDEVTGGRMQFCLSGGAGLKPAIKEFLYAHGLLIIEGYGLTEASPTLTLNRPGDFRFDSVGKPLPSVELKLAEDGEILARGPNVFAGYHKDPAATREVLTEDGWLLTGDIGRWTEDGFLQIVDRKKDILVTAGGKNIAPANIELRFRDEPLLEHVVVYGDGQKYLVAGVWPSRALVDAELVRRGVERSDAEVKALLWERVEAVNETLARHETIKKIAVLAPALTVEAGDLTATLKVRRKAVVARWHEAFEALYAPDSEARHG